MRAVLLARIWLEIHKQRLGNKYAQLQLRKYESSITTNTFAWKILMEIYSSQTAQPLHKHFFAFVRKDRTELIWSWRNTLHSTTAQDVKDEILCNLHGFRISAESSEAMIVFVPIISPSSLKAM